MPNITNPYLWVVLALITHHCVLERCLGRIHVSTSYLVLDSEYPAADTVMSPHKDFVV
jgi:hypothetical protein